LRGLGSNRHEVVVRAVSTFRHVDWHAKLRILAAMLGVGICAVFFGLLATTANPILIGLGAGIILGPVLLLMPELTIWVVLVLGLLMGVVSASPQFSKAIWIVSILSFMLLLSSLVNMAWNKQRQVPGFMLLALVFMLYAILVSMIQWHSFGEFVAGFKRYFQSFGLMVALTMLIFSPPSYVRWRRFLLVVALLQFPFALYELLVLVPQRGGLALSSETTDVIAGTFGANLQGGSPNSVMVTYLFVALSFLVARWRSGLIGSGPFYLLALICLLPLGMGETKIAVFMLPLVGFILIRKDLAHSPLRYVPALLAVAVLTMMLGYLYVTVIMHSNLDEVVNTTLRYNVGDQGYSRRQLLNRLTSITFWFKEQGFHDPASFLIGNGLGSSFSSLGALGGHLGLKYLNYGINLTAGSTLLWDTGLIGLVLFVSIFVAAWVAAGRLYHTVSDPAVKADALAIQAAISLFLLFLFYSDSIVNLVSMELIYAVVLGYLGYLLNLHGLVGKLPTNEHKIKSHV